MSVTGQSEHDVQVPVATWRIQVTKIGSTKYMSHLDFIRTVERSVRRAGLPITLSGGFNPRPRLSFSPALPVGVSSRSEFVDIMLKEPVDTNEASLKLNMSFPSGMRVVSSRILPPNVPALSAIIQASAYKIDLHGKGEAGLERVSTAVDEILDSDSIPFTRVTRKGIRKVDLRPLIYDVRVEPSDSPVSIYATVATGSRGNVRPFDLVHVILDFQGVEMREVFVNITREGLYVFCDGKLRLPW